MRINPESLARASSRHPWRVIGVWGVLFFVMVGLASTLLGDVLNNDISFTNRPEQKRQTEAKLWEAFEAERPVILGALLDAVSASLRNQSRVRLPRMPRMADFAVRAAAAAPALGWSAEDFLLTSA